MKESLAGRVREIAFRRGEFSLVELMEEASVRDYAQKKKLLDVIKRLKVSGELVQLKKEFYQYRQAEKPLMKIERMWRAMRIKKQFSRRDILLLSGASREHLKKYFLCLEKQGHIARTSGKGYQNGLYRLANSETAPETAPRLPKRG
jgi:hypothetical protein